MPELIQESINFLEHSKLSYGNELLMDVKNCWIDKHNFIIITDLHDASQSVLAGMW